MLSIIAIGISIVTFASLVGTLLFVHGVLGVIGEQLGEQAREIRMMRDKCVNLETELRDRNEGEGWKYGG